MTTIEDIGNIGNIGDIIIDNSRGICPTLHSIHSISDDPHPEGSSDDRLVEHCQNTVVKPDFRYKIVWREHGGYRPVSGDGTLINELHGLAQKVYESLVSGREDDCEL